MIKLMIVEDEDIVREGLIQAFQWEEMGYFISAVAENGRTALEKYGESMPDAVLTDIKMPEMDGLELLRRLKEINSDVEVVLLSGYDDFQYAKKGIDFGAFSYILKLNLSDELEGVMKSLYKHIDEKKENTKAIREMSGYVASDRLLGLLEGRTEQLTDAEDCQAFATVVSLPDMKAVKGLAKELDSFLDRAVAAVKQGCIVIIFDCSLDNEQFEICKRERVSMFQSELDKRILGDYVIGIGSKVRMEGIRDSYREAMRMTDLGRLMNRKGVFDYGKEGSRLKQSRKPGVLANFKEHIVNGDQDGLLQQLNEEFLKAIGCDSYPIERLRSLCCQIIAELYHIIENMGGIQSIKEISNIMNTIGKNDSFIELDAYVTNEVIKAFKEINGMKKAGSCVNMDSVVAFVTANYTKDIRMEEVAAFFYVSPAYFSVKFKDKVGINFTEYLKKLRLSKAQEMLMGSEMKICEICEKIGYNDEKHFFRLFKKEFGISPGIYREEHRRR